MSIARVMGIPISGLDRVHGLAKSGLDRIHGLSGVPADDGSTATLPTPDAYWRLAPADASAGGVADIVAGRDLNVAYGALSDVWGLYDSGLRGVSYSVALLSTPISAPLTYPSGDTVIAWCWLRSEPLWSGVIRIGPYIVATHYLAEDLLSTVVTVGVSPYRTEVELSGSMTHTNWHMLGIIRTPSNVRVYFDGAVRGTSTPADLSCGNDHYWIGFDGVPPTPTGANVGLSDVGIIIGEDDPVGVLDAIWNSGVGMVYRSGSGWIDPGEAI